MDLARVAKEAGGLGLFIRSLVGLDRGAAKESFARFLDDTLFNANQIEFVNLIIDELASNGTITAKRFYELPFTDISPVDGALWTECTSVGCLTPKTGRFKVFISKLI